MPNLRVQSEQRAMVEATSAEKLALTSQIEKGETELAVLKARITQMGEERTKLTAQVQDESDAPSRVSLRVCLRARSYACACGLAVCMAAHVLTMAAATIR